MNQNTQLNWSDIKNFQTNAVLYKMFKRREFEKIDMLIIKAVLLRIAKNIEDDEKYLNRERMELEG
jgi:hypothetical protein